MDAAGGPWDRWSLPPEDLTLSYEELILMTVEELVQELMFYLHTSEVLPSTPPSSATSESPKLRGRAGSPRSAEFSMRMD